MPAKLPPCAVRAAAHLMLAAVAAFAIVCGAAQFWRTDLNPIAVPLSLYLTGPGGGYVRLVYDLMGLALVGFAVGSYCATSAGQRSVLALLLFVLAGLLLPIVAATELFLRTAHEAAAALLHGLAAQATFLMLSFGMLLLSSRWHRDARFKKRPLMGLTLAWLATAVLWLRALTRNLPHGLMQKLLIALILAWLCWAALQLRRLAAGSSPAK